MGDGRGGRKNEKNILHHVHVNVSKVDGNGSQVGRGQAASRGREVVCHGAVDDARFSGGNFDALTQRGGLVGGQRERLQTLDQAQVADGSEIETDVGQGV